MDIPDKSLVNDQVLLNEYLTESERTLNTCDAYDVKASIWLAVIVFIASQTGSIMEKNIPRYFWYGEWLAAFLLAVAGIITLVELYPRDYRRYSPSNGTLDRWITALRVKYKDDPSAEVLILQKTTARKLLWLKEMINENKKLNSIKARLLMFSFWTAAIAATINLVSLAAIHLFSRSL